MNWPFRYKSKPPRKIAAVWWADLVQQEVFPIQFPGAAGMVRLGRRVLILLEDGADLDGRPWYPISGWSDDELAIFQEKSK